ncbi:hypothetical protein IAR50_007314 [Cryptococcus sp. DSM 104548]
MSSGSDDEEYAYPVYIVSSSSPSDDRQALATREYLQTIVDEDTGFRLPLPHDYDEESMDGDHLEDEVDLNITENPPRIEDYRQIFTDANHQRSTADRGHSVTFVFSPSDTGRSNRPEEEVQSVTLFQSTSLTNPDGEELNSMDRYHGYLPKEDGEGEEQVMTGDAIRGQLAPRRDKTPLIWSKIEGALTELPDVLDGDKTVDSSLVSDNGGVND